MEVKTYTVTLEVLNVEPDDSEDVANAIYEVRNDAFVYATGGVVYIELPQNTVSGFDAILGAQVDVKKAGYNTKLAENNGDSVVLEHSEGR